MLWRYSALSPVSKVILVVESKQRGDGDPNRVCAYLWWLIGTGYGASQGARLPAGPISPPHVVAEGRPSCFFLPAKEPIGRQLIFSMESMSWCHGSSAVPSGIVLGDDVAAPVKMSGTQLRCSSGCWGPLCKMQGPVCYLGLVLGPFANYCSNINAVSGSFWTPLSFKKKVEKKTTKTCARKFMSDKKKS